MKAQSFESEKKESKKGILKANSFRMDTESKGNQDMDYSDQLNRKSLVNINVGRLEEDERNAPLEESVLKIGDWIKIDLTNDPVTKSLLEEQ